MPESGRLGCEPGIPVALGVFPDRGQVIAGLSKDGALRPLTEKAVVLAEGTEVARAGCA